MSRPSRDLYRRKLEKLLSQTVDEEIIGLISAIVSIQSGNPKFSQFIPDLPPDIIGSKLGSTYNIPPWTLETIVNELLAIPKKQYSSDGSIRILRGDRFESIRKIVNILVNLENSEDGIFLSSHDVFVEMARIAQRQFHWQTGVTNAPHFYRSILFYGTGEAGNFFEKNTGLSVSEFVKIGIYLSSSLSRNVMIQRQRDLSEIGVTPQMREAALARFVISHEQARLRVTQMRARSRHTAYQPSILRDFPVLAFGDRSERLRAPIPDLITYRYTSGLYLDVVRGGASVWTEIGNRFEQYVLEYLESMMIPYKIHGETEYGPKKNRFRTPDILVSNNHCLTAVFECKAKRMTFEARFADDPMVEDARGFEEMAKGIFQIWRFFAHARHGMTAPLQIAADCQGVIITADSWLKMARNQAEAVLNAAHTLADQEGSITPDDRKDIAFCQIDEVEYVLQQGSADSLLAACREIASGEKKGWMLSAVHTNNLEKSRPYPFTDRIQKLLPWIKVVE